MNTTQHFLYDRCIQAVIALIRVPTQNTLQDALHQKGNFEPDDQPAASLDPGDLR